ncbi:UDP-N-acetylmuramate dehydrogenase [Bacteroides sp.]|uniref:UDP-N-acetylmuramate dehydrogenase n=1 Tax=Bacteroides sp. TaxID=29523 RepID=UPI0025BF743E|nr:UDP-N-acetylmuramate dehydrogenase [Bacteroides sp.]
MKEYTNYPILRYNTFGMDVKTSCFVEYSSVSELQSFLSAKEYSLPLLHIGGGSNLLFLSDFKGTILHSAIKGIDITEESDEWIDIKVGAGEVWDDFVSYTVSKGFYGAENLSIIPGEVGASAVQNIGAYGVEAKDIILTVHTVRISDSSERVFSNEECRYSYRNSIFKGEMKGQYIVTHVTFRLRKSPEFHLSYGNISSELEKRNLSPSLANIRDIIIEVRRSKLPEPEEFGNAGSFFMNPMVSIQKFKQLESEFPDIPHYPVDENTVKIPAGWMIDRCGWKGRNIGPAGVYHKQALVLVNLGGATGKDISCLADEIIKSVYEKFGVDIHPEVNYIY